jgi:hypothetical protein
LVTEIFYMRREIAGVIERSTRVGFRCDADEVEN